MEIHYQECCDLCVEIKFLSLIFISSCSSTTCQCVLFQMAMVSPAFKVCDGKGQKRRRMHGVCRTTTSIKQNRILTFTYTTWLLSSVCFPLVINARSSHHHKHCQTNKHITTTTVMNTGYLLQTRETTTDISLTPTINHKPYNKYHISLALSFL